MLLYLLLIRKRTSATYNGGIDEWLRDNHILQKGNLIALTVQFNNKDSADPEPRNVRGILNYNW